MNPLSTLHSRPIVQPISLSNIEKEFIFLDKWLWRDIKLTDQETVCIKLTDRVVHQVRRGNFEQENLEHRKPDTWSDKR